MARDKRAYLWDIRKAVSLLETFTAGKTFDDYASDPLLRAAVEREFEIIDEALAQATKHFPELQRSIRNCAPFVSFRNRLIHGYSVVSHPAVWGVVQADLAELKHDVELLLAEASDK